jgi:two-component system, NarL family, sensor histidine kinase DesK
MSASKLLRSLRRAPPRAHEAHAWPRFIWLMYLVFLFLPALLPFSHTGWLRATLATLPVFFALYYWSTHASRRGAVCALIGITLLDYALIPVNPFANTYLLYTAALLPFAINGFLRPLLLTMGLVAVHVLEVFLLGPIFPIGAAFTSLLAMGCCLGNSAMVESRLKSEALLISHQEIRRLAAVAERERIGRDLHDLLGHTLSLIAIKSELASKLMARDRDQAAREVAEVTGIARDALRQVRVAVTGMRTAALEGEFSSARALLEPAGVTLSVQRDLSELPPEIETALAMIVREATTNIQRHADAGKARVEVRMRPGELLLTVSDDGRGGITRHGSGLIGIGERVRSLGGVLEIESPRGGGTVLRSRFPIEAAPPRTAIQAVQQALP